MVRDTLVDASSYYFFSVLVSRVRDPIERFSKVWMLGLKKNTVFFNRPLKKAF